ncbi:DNA-binding NarL/FixJ family response regulator [Deinobacterium chartae]|uniref:DNA-binding NarL/FixJ family response regulator n=1 Tax=Deinobacterium chartae TaxID=521158 RepID=A0A841I146_9DEIO|nr:DNA-binding NarL/FixJ family response regulator [Deinobacterium chartae]
MRIVIADDHPLFRMGLRYALAAQGFEVVGEAADGVEAVVRCLELRPDVALMDVKMPRQDGISACAELVARLPDVVVILLTTFGEPAIVSAARRAGARGFLSKETQPAELAEAVARIVGDPERDWLPAVALPQFTPRETDVLNLLLEGLSNKQIASRLGISPDTVKDYVSSVLGKLEVSDRMGALRRSRELGLR